ncbi:MAG: 3',5'-cyclic-AMP phosphodiesterase [Woeseiaceae bacterium]|nr:3',5'-cyclic-AMP phosphodiesterase [Woeseiaceae bacterium]
MTSDPVRVLHITDPHLFADAESSLRGTVTHSSLSRVLEHVEQAGWPADFVAMTGDLIQDDSRAAYDRFRELMSTLDLPVYCVPGNHDVRALMKDAVSQKPFYYCESVQHGNWLITGIDSCVHGKASGRIEAAEMQRLEGILARTTAEHVMICLHHPPLPVGSKWLDQVGLENGEEFLRTIAQTGKVRCVIFGHVHQDYFKEHAGIEIIATPSTCRQFKPGSDEFALDDNPPGYRRLSLHADGKVDKELIWLDTQ